VSEVFCRLLFLFIFDGPFLWRINFKKSFARVDFVLWVQAFLKISEEA